MSAIVAHIKRWGAWLAAAALAVLAVVLGLLGVSTLQRWQAERDSLAAAAERHRDIQARGKAELDLTAAKARATILASPLSSGPAPVSSAERTAAWRRLRLDDGGDPGPEEGGEA